MARSIVGWGETGRRGVHARTLTVLAASLALVVSGLVAVAGPAGAHAGPASHCSPGRLTGPSRVVLSRNHVVSAALATVVSCGKWRFGAGDPAMGQPPLRYHGGRVMSVPSVGNKVVVRPIFWTPPGYSFTTPYKNLIVKYLTDVAAASNTNNIFATNTEYNGTNGVVHYGVRVGRAINDTNALPTQKCTVDTGAVYADNSGYTACLDDAQIIAETRAQVTGASLPTDLGHMYVMFTPKHIESCFFSDAQAIINGGNQCTINPTGPLPLGTSAYCAYHSSFGPGKNSIYAEMPFPVYGSAIPLSCTDENLRNSGVIQSPNGNTDGDVEVSPLSHEMSEAITDPNGNAWYDKAGFENGDECAYTYGRTHGTAGKFYNQTVNGHHYLTQEEFSNNDFFLTHGGCVQGEPRPSITSMSPKKGKHSGGTLVTIKGRYFLRASKVLFGGKAAPRLKYISGTKLAVRTPAHRKGTVSVAVQTIGGKSPAKRTIKFTFR